MTSEARNQKTALKILLIAVVVFSCVGALGFFAVAQLVHFLNVPPAPRASAAGKVIYYKYTRPVGKYGSSRIECTVSYQVGGQKYATQSGGCGGYTGFSDEVSVVYQTTNPQNATIDNRWLGNYCAILGVFLAIVAFWMIKSLRRALKKGGDNSPPENTNLSLNQ